MLYVIYPVKSLADLLGFFYYCIKMPKVIYPLEHEEQKRVFETCKYLKIANTTIATYDLMFAIPNGGSRLKRRGLSLEAISLKAEGVKLGVPDIFLAHANSHYHGLFIEMKRASKSLSKVSDEQKLWQERLLK